VPEAEDALRLVLEGRGYSQDELARNRLRRTAAETNKNAVEPPATRPAVRVSYAHPALRPFNLTLMCLIIPVVVILVLLAMPILGNYIVIGGASLLGCNTGEDAIHPCHFLGMDIGDFVNGYVVDAFIAGAANPILAFFALGVFVRSPAGIIWSVVVVGLFVARALRRRRLMGKGE